MLIITRREYARCLLILLVVLLVAPLLSCNKESTCKRACKRVARCRLEVRQGSKPILGEREMPPDERCMTRCVEEPEEFAKCEGKMRTCAKLRSCWGSLR